MCILKYTYTYTHAVSLVLHTSYVVLVRTDHLGVKQILHTFGVESIHGTILNTIAIENHEFWKIDNFLNLYEYAMNF